MTRFLLLLSLTLSLFSCRSERGENMAKQQNVAQKKPGAKAPENIRFDFTATLDDSASRTYEIRATLFNDGMDTAYFLSTTCYGESYSLRYDTANFVCSSLIMCNDSYPQIVSIAPKGQHDFMSFLFLKSTGGISGVHLGFDFYSVNADFNLAGKRLGDLNIFNRPEAAQTIVWAAEKKLQ